MAIQKYRIADATTYTRTLSLTMKGTSKHKVVSSGRLTGGVKAQPARRRVTPKPVPWTEPAYSLYSTDSEDQVTTIHKGLDRCAALLSDILQAERAEAKPSVARAVKGGAAKPRTSSSMGKKTTKKPVTKTVPVQKNILSSQSYPGLTASHQSSPSEPNPPFPASLLCGPLQSSQSQSVGQQPSFPQCLSTRPALTLSQSHPPLQPQTPPYSLPPLSQLLSLSACLPLPQSHCQPPLTQTDCQSGSKAPQTECRAQGCQWSHDSEPSSVEGCGHRGKEEECVPVRDRNSQSRSEGCTAEMEVKVKTVQYLLGELKALITGQGGVAEKLLSDLEQTVSLLPLNVGSSNIQAEIALVLQPLRSQNTQLRRRVRILNQQLQERERAERENMERHSDSEVLTLQAELSAAQSRLQELQDDTRELQQALQDTQSQLRDRETENTLIKTDLEGTSSRLLESERERSEVALLAQQRLEEIQNLNRILQSHVSSDSPTVIDSSASGPPLTKQLLEQYGHSQDPSELAPDPVSQYLISLGQNGRVLTCHSDTQLEPTASVDEVVGRCVCVLEREESVCAKKKLTFAPLRETMMSSHPIMGSQQGGSPPVTSVAHCQSLDTILRLLRQSKSLISPHLDQSHSLSSGLARSSGKLPEKGRGLDHSLSQCEVGSVSSNWSVGSGSTFDTRDEVAFRDGLAALDASIVSLQRTIKMDLRR
ncbi:coiled-coil domain-containing protein 14 [Centroberyx gerrardi]